MARILFVNTPAHGHVNPTFPMVSAFVEAGYSVDYLITEDFRKKVEYCNATLIPYYKPVNINFNNKFSTLRYIRKFVKEMSIKLKELAPQYDVVVIGGLTPSIAKLEKEIKVPIVFCSAVFLQNEKTIRKLFKKSRGTSSTLNFIALHPKIRRFISRIIMSPILGVKINDLLNLFSPQSSTLNVVFTSKYFQPLEETFDDKCLFIGPTPTISVKDDSFPMDKLEKSKKKIIYATLGTIFNTWTEFFVNVIEAFKDSDYLVVMSTGNKERLKQIGDIPENFIVRDFVPQAEVLKHADLFIAHGGMGSVSDGMSFGVPMILVPLGADQFFNAYRLQELGAGKVLKKEEVTGENLRSEAKLVMESKSFKEGVRKIQESFISAGGPGEAVREVEKILKKK
jgi:MGT family glycosyltransferase